ncbi:hypothetical protein ACIFQM_21560 [Paenibacillus sp. NRS-1782]|uniref:hypothetical protein n=1 Tax=unclassified Paenibacillus TaxID=185978 RepID=UPI003D2703B5
MSDWPNWFQEALRQRFYELELASEQNASCSSEDKNLFTQIEQLKISQNENIQLLLSEWEEAIGYQLSQDKQSMYMEGVKDGIRLILPAHVIPHHNCISELDHFEWTKGSILIRLLVALLL